MRIPTSAIAETAVLLGPEQVTEGDPRLAHLDEGFCRLITYPSPGPSFVLWPDDSLGFAWLQPDDDEPMRTAKLIEAYNEARQQLEKLAEQSTAHVRASA
jgi:hypothetical protein